jgi:hypothetical protein
MANVAEKSLTIEPTTWGDDVEALIRSAFPHPSDHKRATLDAMRIEVQRGEAKAFLVKHEARAVLVFVLKVEGTEGVILLGAGSMEGVDLTATIMPHIESLFIGCTSVRVHTERAGLTKKLACMGYQAREIVLSKHL